VPSAQPLDEEVVLLVIVVLALLLDIARLKTAR